MAIASLYYRIQQATTLYSHNTSKYSSPWSQENHGSAYHGALVVSGRYEIFFETLNRIVTAESFTSTRRQSTAVGRLARAGSREADAACVLELP
jgi:hypothetical protein